MRQVFFYLPIPEWVPLIGGDRPVYGYGVMIGLGFGRIGCFLNGCCEGAACNLPWPMAVQYPYESLPYQLDLQNGRINPNTLPPLLRDGVGMPLPPRKFAQRAKEIQAIDG